MGNQTRYNLDIQNGYYGESDLSAPGMPATCAVSYYHVPHYPTVYYHTARRRTCGIAPVAKIKLT